MIYKSIFASPFLAGSRFRTILFKSFSKGMDTQNVNLLEGPVDRFNGILIDTEKIPVNIDEFPNQLKNSFVHWNSKSIRTVWIKVNILQSAIIPILAESGFNFHHANHNFVMMYKWLPANLLENIPDYPHTMIGVGGLVLNKKDQVLVISEKHGLIPGYWKLPGGYVNPNEDFVAACIREVSEETGLKTEFESLVCVRHALGGTKNISFNFGCSDLYIVIALKAELDDLNPCDREIEKCRWMDFNEYLDNPKITQMNRLFLEQLLQNRKDDVKIDKMEHIHEVLKRKYQLYFVKKSD